MRKDEDGEAKVKGAEGVLQMNDSHLIYTNASIPYMGYSLQTYSNYMENKGYTKIRWKRTKIV